MPATMCPSAEQLAAFQAGKLSHEELSQIAEHLESCPACQTSLETGSTAGDETCCCGAVGVNYSAGEGSGLRLRECDRTEYQSQRDSWRESNGVVQHDNLPGIGGTISAFEG